MTVQSEVGRWTGAGNGTATSFPFTRRVLQSTDLLVYLTDDTTGTETQQILTTSYTVSGVGSDAGGAVNFIIPPPAGTTVLIRSARPYTQPSDFRNLGRFLPEIHQNAIDGLQVQIQQLRDVVERAVRGPINGAAFGQLPPTSELLSKYLYVDSSYNVVGVTGSPSQPLTHSTEIVYGVAGQTVIPVSAYTPGAGNLTVKVNGIEIVLFDDYDETSPQSVTLVEPLTDGDVVILKIGEVFLTSLTKTGKTVFTAIATEGQTVIPTPEYRPNLDEIEVFINGALLNPPSEYDESSSTTITLALPLAAGDKIRGMIGQPYESTVTVARSLLSGSSATASVFSEYVGAVSKGWRISPSDDDGSGTGELELVPGLANNGTGLTTMLSLYSVGRGGGTNYERMTAHATNSEFVLESSANGSGTLRPLHLRNGRKDSSGIPGQNAIVIQSDGSVDLPGAPYSAYAQSWCASRTRIADPTNTGSSGLIIDTRTGAPSSVTSDSSFIEYRRGGAGKWRVGINTGGTTNDEICWYSLGTPASRMNLSTVGLLNTLTGYGVNGTTVLRAKRTGWGIPTGAATRLTFATGSVTLVVLAEHVKALIDDLTFHGMIAA